MTELNHAAEKLAMNIKTLPLSDPILRHLEAAAAEFLHSKGFDISTRPGCIAALAWLDEAKVEEAFWNEDGVSTAADWYIGEARLDGMRRIIERRLQDVFPSRCFPTCN
jgi:hypothetical protein